MRAFISRLIGVLLITAAVLGLSLSILGLLYVWTSQAAINAQVRTTLDTLDQALSATSDMMVVINDSLEQASSDIELIDNAIIDVATTINTTADVANSVGDLLVTDFTAVVTDTQESLSSVEASARLIDDTLRVVSAVPLIGARYRPEVPLQTSIAQVSASLNQLPTSLEAVQGELDQTAISLQEIQTDLDQLGKSVANLRQTLSEAQTVMQQYEDIYAKLQADVDRLETNLPRWMQVATWGLTLGLIWLGLVQIAFFLQGFMLIGRPTTVSPHTMFD